MDSIFTWSTGVFDEISLVYEKAKEKESAQKLLRALEEQALAEVHQSCSLLPLKKTLSEKEAQALPVEQKEQFVARLADLGLSSFHAELTEPKISVQFSPVFPAVMGCTFFSVLNRLEKLDGGINMLYPKVTLELTAPLGGKKGLFQWEFLILQLYPWLSVSEVSANYVATHAMVKVPEPESEKEDLPSNEPAQPEPEEPTPPPEAKPERPDDMKQASEPGFGKPESAPQKQKKKGGFLLRLFKHRKQEQSSDALDAKVVEPESDATHTEEIDPAEIEYYTKQYLPLVKKLKEEGNRTALNALLEAEEKAMLEVQKHFKIRGQEQTEESFAQIPRAVRLNYALLVGAQDVRKSFMYIVSMSEFAPYCDALTLMMIAFNDPKERKQMVDAGDGADASVLQKAVDYLKPCCPDWNCKVIAL